MALKWNVCGVYVEKWVEEKTYIHNSDVEKENKIILRFSNCSLLSHGPDEYPRTLEKNRENFMSVKLVINGFKLNKNIDAIAIHRGDEEKGK